MQIGSIGCSINNQNLLACRANGRNKDNKSNVNKLTYAFGALAGLTLLGITYKHLHVKKPKPIRTCTYQDLYESLSAKEQENLEKELVKLDFSKVDALKRIKNTHQTDIFKRFVAVMKTKPERPVETPAIITTNASEKDVLNISNYMSKELNFIKQEVTFSPEGKSKNLQEMLKIKDLGKSDKHNLVIITNFEALMETLDKNESLKEEFVNMLEKSHENKLIYICKENPKNPIKIYNKIFLDFET